MTLRNLTVEPRVGVDELGGNHLESANSPPTRHYVCEQLLGGGQLFGHHRR